MNSIKTYLVAAIVLAGLLPVLGAGLIAEWWLLFLFGLWTAVWLLLVWEERVKKTAVSIPPTYANYLLILACLLLAYGAWLNVAAGWLLGSMLATLAAWDLEAFQRRLQPITRLDQEDRLMQTHLHRLFTALALGLLLSTVTLLIQFELRFGWGLLLFLLLILAFSQVIRLLGLER